MPKRATFVIRIYANACRGLLEELIGQSSCSVLAGPNCLPLFHCFISLSTPLSGSPSHFSLSGFVLAPVPSPKHLLPLPSLSLPVWPYHFLLSFSLLLVLGSMTCQWRGDYPCRRQIRQLIIQHFRHQGKSTSKQPHTHRAIWTVWHDTHTIK